MMRFVNALCVWLFFLTLSKGEKCQTLEGTWYNEVGSQLQLSHSENGILSGQYVPKNINEYKMECLQVKLLEVRGSAVFKQSNVVFGFSTTFSVKFVKSWTGQCLLCEGREVLYTSWMLRQSIESCSEEEQSTIIGQDVFTRNSSSDIFTTNEMKPQKTHSRSRSKKKVEVECSSGNRKSSSHSGMDTKKKHPTAGPCTKCLLNGIWYNQLGSKMLIAVHQNMTINGEYLTAVESHMGAAGVGLPNFHGVAVETESSCAIALQVIWNNGTSTTVWVGQCLLCGMNQTPVLLTNWILRSQVQSCDDNWKAFLYGEDVFTKYEQKMVQKRFGGTP